jgi:hypothetical protein
MGGAGVVAEASVLAAPAAGAAASVAAGACPWLGTCD